MTSLLSEISRKENNKTIETINTKNNVLKLMIGLSLSYKYYLTFILSDFDALK